MKLEEIGFYTLSENRAKNISGTSPLWRAEMILTDSCNFKCSYCRGLREDCKGDINLNTAKLALNTWIKEGLMHVRFSGGEPTIYKELLELVKLSRKIFSVN